MVISLMAIETNAHLPPSGAVASFSSRGRSWAVITALTPGKASALLVLIFLIGMWIRTAHDFGPQHAGEVDVCTKGGFAGYSLRRHPPSLISFRSLCVHNSLLHLTREKCDFPGALHFLRSLDDRRQTFTARLHSRKLRPQPATIMRLTPAS